MARLLLFLICSKEIYTYPKTKVKSKSSNFVLFFTLKQKIPYFPVIRKTRDFSSAHAVTFEPGIAPFEINVNIAGNGYNLDIKIFGDSPSGIPGLNHKWFVAGVISFGNPLEQAVFSAAQLINFDMPAFVFYPGIFPFQIKHNAVVVIVMDTGSVC